MKRIILLATAALLVMGGCGKSVYQKDYEDRLSTEGLKPFMTLPSGLDRAEREALQFLYAYMPLADVTDYSTAFYLENVRASLKLRHRWGVPDREWRHFVLPLRVNNENLDSSRVVFARELLPRIEGLSMEDAILEVNHWCHEKVTYQPSDARTSSPLNTVRNALGRCGEESTFLVAALRSVGIPARQVYTPRWAHTDDNHAWVEAWAGGQWHFLGACEPEPVLDLGWFNVPASRAMLMHTKVFGRYDGPEEVVLESPNYTEINLIDNYAQTARVDFLIQDALGAPAPGARVDFCIYNYAEFYPAVTKYADAEGRCFTSAGLGDMLVWASLDGAYGFEKVSFGKDTEVTIRLSHRDEITLANQYKTVQLTMVPPPEKAAVPEVTPQQRALNDVRFAREDSLRHAYEATFRDPKARGNWETIEAFRKAPRQERVQAVLDSLSTKDWHDVTRDILLDYYCAPVFLGARVENEFLTPFYGFFANKLTSAESPEALVQWVRDSITVLPSDKAWNIAMSPAGVYGSRLALPRSRDIFFVSAARAKGFEARKDPVTGKVQYRSGGIWLDVDFDGETATEAPQGTLRLTYEPEGTVSNPGYYTHFTLSRLENGRPHLMAFDEGEVDMGGGMDWEHAFRKGVRLDAGNYLLVSGNRLSNGSVPVTLSFFTLPKDVTTVVDLEIREEEGTVPVIGFFDAEGLFRAAGAAAEQSLLSAVGRGFYVVMLLEPGKEPTNHALRDMAASRESLEAWGRPIVLLCASEAALARVQKENAEGRYGKLPGNVVWGVDSRGLVKGACPVVLLADTFNRLFFRSEGYTIGLGEQLSGTVARL